MFKLPRNALAIFFNDLTNYFKSNYNEYHCKQKK